jgi:hypothetical protein
MIIRFDLLDDREEAALFGVIVQNQLRDIHCLSFPKSIGA